MRIDVAASRFHLRGGVTGAREDVVDLAGEVDVVQTVAEIAVVIEIWIVAEDSTEGVAAGRVLVEDEVPAMAVDASELGDPSRGLDRVPDLADDVSLRSQW